MNTDRVGYYKSDELNERSSRGELSMQGDIRLGDDHLRRIVRIVKSEIPHTQNHPMNKQIGKGWVLSFEGWSSYNSPLMYWSTGSTDILARHTFKFHSLSQAVKFCETLGWGYDILN